MSTSDVRAVLRGKSDVSRHIALTVIIGAVTGALMGLAYASTSDQETLIKLFTALTIPGFAYYLGTWKRLKQPMFMPFPVFLIAVYVYHLGQPLMYMFGAKTGLLGNDRTLDLFRFSLTTIQQVITFTWINLTALQIGGLLAYRKYGGLNLQLPLGAAYVRNSKSVLIVGSIMAIVAFVPAVRDLITEIVFRSTGTLASYVAQNEKVGVADVQAVIGQAFIPGLLFIAVAAGERRWLRNLVIGICTVWFVLNTLSGDRSNGVLPLIAVLWVINTVYKQMPWRYLFAIGAFLMFVVNPVVALTRNSGSLTSVTPEMITNSLFGEKNPVVLFFDETGISAIPLADTLELVPETQSPHYGVGYIQNILLGPVNFLLKPLGSEDYEVPAYWLITQRYRNRLATSSFLGFSYVGETYLEFGPMGFLVSILIGYVLSYVTLVAIKSRSARVLGALAISLLFMIHFSRGDSGEIGRPLIRYILIPMVFMAIIDLFGKKKRPEERALAT